MQLLAEMLSVENVVAQNQAHRVIADEFFADQKRLGQTVRSGLFLVVKMHAKLAAITQQVAILRQVLRGGNNQDFTDAGQHQDRDRVIDHRFVIDRQQLFGNTKGDGVQTRARTASQNDAFHHAIKSLRSVNPSRSPW